jgi:large subunit ribosomal protein L18
LCIHKSLKHLYAQVIDDTRGVTICAATTNTKKNKGDAARGFANVAAARRLGGELAALARSRGVDQVVFDRGGCRYHGVIKAFGDAAREGGLKF